ncbi:MAG TPA: carboxypeptidase-like regulatory domain-containing protein [Planctomycetota bacterium]|nr:carboxypeptidase-like regulatory domain-containing protein [Planctomycetota bacterium]
MLLYTDQARRIAVAVTVLVAVSVVVYILLLPRHTQTEAGVIGVVVRPDGAPIGGATVFVLYNPYEDARRATSVAARAATYAEGTFATSGLQFREYYLVAIHPDYCDSEGVEVWVTAQGVNGVRVALLEGGQVTGTVDPSQGPVANRVVSLMSHQGGRGWARTKTDSGGRFQFDKVIAQDYTIELKPPGWGTSQSSGHYGPRRQIQVHVGRTTTVNFGRD